MCSRELTSSTLTSFHPSISYIHHKSEKCICTRIMHNHLLLNINQISDAQSRRFKIRIPYLLLYHWCNRFLLPSAFGQETLHHCKAYGHSLRIHAWYYYMHCVIVIPQGISNRYKDDRDLYLHCYDQGILIVGIITVTQLAMVSSNLRHNCIIGKLHPI